MNPEDKNDFVKALAGLGEIYSKKISAEMAAIYFRCMEDFTIEEFKNAASLHVKDPEHGRWFPMPAHLIAKMPRKLEATMSVEDKARSAWVDVMEALRRIGPTQKPGFDSVTARCIGALGGWSSLCRLTYDELKWKQRTFVEFFSTIYGTPENLSIGYDKQSQKTLESK